MSTSALEFDTVVPGHDKNMFDFNTSEMVTQESFAGKVDPTTSGFESFQNTILCTIKDTEAELKGCVEIMISKHNDFARTCSTQQERNETLLLEVLKMLGSHDERPRLGSKSLTQPQPLEVKRPASVTNPQLPGSIPENGKKQVDHSHIEPEAVGLKVERVESIGPRSKTVGALPAPSRAKKESKPDDSSGGGGQPNEQMGWRSSVKKTFNKRKRTLQEEMEILKCHSTGGILHALNNYAPWIRKLVQHRCYEWTSGVLILLNCFYMGVHVQWFASNVGDADERTVFLVIDTFFTALFSIDLGLRLIAEGKLFFNGKEWRWNLFDFVCVFGGSCQTIVDLMKTQGGASVNVSILRNLRVIRLVRTLRIVRIMRVFRDLRMMMVSILSSFQSMIWAMIVLCMSFYVFALCLTVGTTDFFNRESPAPDEEDAQLLRSRFGSIDRSMLSLFMAMTGGIDWGDLWDLLEPLSAVYRAIFLTYVSFAVLVLVNIVTGVFVENAMQSSQNDQAQLYAEYERTRGQFLNQMKKLFTEMDKDGSGLISKQEFEGFMGEDVNKVYFYNLKLDPEDALMLFALLDVDQSGEVEIEEFCEGIRKLGRESRVFDLSILQLEMRWLLANFQGFADYMESRIKG